MKGAKSSRKATANRSYSGNKVTDHALPTTMEEGRKETVTSFWTIGRFPPFASIL